MARAAGGEGAPRPAVVYSEDYVAAQFEVLNLRVIHNKRRTGFEETKDFPIRVDELVAGRYQVPGPARPAQDGLVASMLESCRCGRHAHVAPPAPRWVAAAPRGTQGGRLVLTGLAASRGRCCWAAAQERRTA